MDLLTMQRLGRQLQRHKVPLLPALIRRMMRVLYQANLPFSTDVGPGTQFAWNGVGNFIHPGARIGKRCLLSPFVVIGGRQGLEGGALIGDYVRIGAGAKILGPVKIGDFAVVGANAVVTRDVEAGTVVGGVPARELRRMEDPAGEYERAMGEPVPLVDRQRAPAWEPPKVQVLEMPPPSGQKAAPRDPPELDAESGDLLA